MGSCFPLLFSPENVENMTVVREAGRPVTMVGMLPREISVFGHILKAGLIGAAKALAREVGRKRILVNVVAPGVTETEMTEKLPKEQILPLIPMQRFGTPEDVAAVVDFLCSETHMYIHGQVIAVNGGLC